jgi:hypothetical protein
MKKTIALFLTLADAVSGSLRKQTRYPESAAPRRRPPRPPPRRPSPASPPLSLPLGH